MMRLTDLLFRPTWWIAPLLLCSPLACRSKLTACEISETACQEDIYYAVLGVRGDGIDPFGGLPPVRVITPAQYRDELLARANQSVAAASPEAQQYSKAWDAALGLLHFIDAKSTASETAIDDQVSNVAAYYSSVDRAVTVLSRTSSSGQTTGRMQSLAHEFVHALQDRELLLRWTASSIDEALALGAVIEGDAQFYEVLFANELSEGLGSPLGLTQDNIVSVFELSADRIYSSFERSSPYFFPRIIRYPLAAQHVARAWSRGGNAAVRRAYASAPVRSVGLLRPGAAPVVRDCRPPDAAGLTAFPSDAQMGALYVYAFLRAWSVSHELALSTAGQWSGDDLRVFMSPAGEHTAVAWRIEFEAPPSASLLDSLATDATMGASIEGNRLLLTATNSPDPIAWSAVPDCR